MPRLGCLALVLSGSALAQTTTSPATVPANYHGPNVVGACFYVQNNAAFYAYPINISNYFRLDAERAFHKFVQTSTGQALPATCRWVTEQQYNASADKSFTAKNSAGQAVPATRLNWQYTPGSGGMTNTAATTPVNRNPGYGASTATTNTPASPVAGTSASSTASNTASSAATGVGGSISDSVNSSKQAITASGATAVTDTMSSATTAVTGALQNGMGRLFHKKQAATATDPQQAPQQAAAAAAPQPGTTGAPAPAASSFAVTADTAAPGAAAATPAGGPSFVFCHLVASGSEYVSDLFPSTDSSDAAAQTAFWRQVGRQYKLGSIPFSNNVTCARSASESGATSARQTLMASAPTRGLKVVDTQWTWMGQ